MEDNNIVCPVCGCLKYYYKFINCKEIVLCNNCGYWEPNNIGSGLELLDNNHKVDND